MGAALGNDNGNDGDKEGNDDKGGRGAMDKRCIGLGVKDASGTTILSNMFIY
jgi:hypothetical protein